MSSKIGSSNLKLILAVILVCSALFACQRYTRESADVNSAPEDRPEYTVPFDLNRSPAKSPGK